jgi:heptaprenyl diphosphate synthase
MARAFEHVASDDRRVRRWVGDAAARVARGQAREMTDLHSQTVSIDEYLARVLDKTGALFQLASSLGAEAGGFGEEVRLKLCHYAAHVGTAFQLADDLRDILGGPLLGREPGTDLREGVYTLPVLLTLVENRARKEELRQRLRELRWRRDREAVQACCDLVVQNGAVDAAAAMLRACVGEAIAAAGSLQGTLSRVLQAFARAVSYGIPAQLSSMK